MLNRLQIISDVRSKHKGSRSAKNSHVSRELMEIRPINGLLIYEKDLTELNV